MARHAGAAVTAPPEGAPRITPGTVLQFPRDFGAHPGLRTEWWYITGWLHTASAKGSAERILGFQITFFRSRVDTARAASASQFAARQLIFAHTALTDVTADRQWHDQRIARQGFGLAGASEQDTDVTLRDWHLRRSGPAAQSQYHGIVNAKDFALDLRFTQTQPLLLQGDQGYSRKGPRPEQASHYYSQPQLAARGTVRHQGQTLQAQGTAWLDHEWAENILGQEAVGWDWIGMNLADGGALTAFRLRRRDGSTLWTGGSVRAPGQAARAFAHGELRFTPGRTWLSPATRARYPIEWQIDTPGARYTVRALLDAQELDSRQSTGAVYWEGLSDLLDAQGRVIGRGYLEMTGYAGALAL
ncbi:MAG: carotenoid 1,2-hydratase [Rubrivivax sp.]|nr:MAG: carotenoid 1,2-hydratase [Rubrivivax sp.]